MNVFAIGDYVVMAPETADFGLLFTGKHRQSIVQNFAGRVGQVTRLEFRESRGNHRRAYWSMAVHYGTESLIGVPTDWRKATIEEIESHRKDFSRQD